MRSFILLLLTCLGCYGQAFSFADPTVASWGQVSSVATCLNVVNSNTTATFDSALTVGNISNAQYFWWTVTNNTAGTVCKLDMEIWKQGSPTYNISIGIYSTTDYTNPAVQIGGNSDSVAISTFGTSRQTNTFTWSGNYPSITGTNIMVVVKDSAVGDGSNNTQLGMHNPAVATNPKPANEGTSNLVSTLSTTRIPYYKLWKQ